MPRCIARSSELTNAFGTHDDAVLVSSSICCHRLKDLDVSIPLRRPRPRRPEAAAKSECDGAPRSQTRRKTSCHRRCRRDNGCHSSHSRGKVCHGFEDRHGSAQFPDEWQNGAVHCAAADMLDFKTQQQKRAEHDFVSQHTCASICRCGSLPRLKSEARVHSQRCFSAPTIDLLLLRQSASA